MINNVSFLLYLSLPVDPNNSISWFMRCCNKDGVSTDTVHVNAWTTFYVIQMDVAILGDKKDYSMFLADLEMKSNIQNFSMESHILIKSTLFLVVFAFIIIVF